MVRQFTLINANGDVWNLMSKSSFFHAPGGLGFTKSIETEIAGFEFIELRDDLDQKVVSGEMVFADYSVYRDFAKFISHEPLKLGYKPYSTTWYYLDVKVSSLQKTEIDRTTGLLLCPVDFLAFTTWYTIDKYENVVPVPPPVVNLMVQGLSAIIEEDWKIVANSDDDFVYRALVGTVAPDYNTVPVDLPSFAGDVYDLTAGDYYFKAIGKRQNVKSYFQTLPFEDEAEGNPVEIERAVEVAPNSLEVSVSPKQDGTPWINSTQDTDPYTFRSMPSGASGGNREYDKLVGGSVVWNQRVPQYATATKSGVTLTNNGSGVLTASGTSTAGDNHIFLSGTSLIKGHKYLVPLGTLMASGGSAFIYLYCYSLSTLVYFCDIHASHAEFEIYTPDQDLTNVNYYLNIAGANRTFSGQIAPMLTDLTTEFGTTIADYVYSLEQNTAGSGIAWLKSYGFFTKQYYAYSLPTIQSVSVSEKTTIGKNLFDKTATYDVGYFRSDGTIGYNANFSAYYVPVPQGSTITVSGATPNTSAHYCWFDSNKQFVADIGTKIETRTTTAPSGAFYLGLTVNNQNATVPDINKIMVELGSTATTYEAYTANTYSLSTTELRGIPSIVGGQLSYDGDEYASSGTVTRKYRLFDMGSLSYTYDSTNAYFLTSVTLRKYGATILCLSDTYVDVGDKSSADMASVANMSMASNNNNANIKIKNTSYTDPATFKTAMSGKYILCELATPTTESADPFTNPQVIDEHGTESYTDYPMSQGTRDVAIPVGHKSNYALSVPVVGADEVAVNVSGKNLFDGSLVHTSYPGNWGITWDGSVGTLTIEHKNTYTSGTPFVDITLPVGTYVYSYANGSSADLYINGSFSKNLTNGSTFTVNSGNIISLAFPNPSATTRVYEKVQLELGSTATAYVPYTGNTTYTHSLSPTMYGGTVEMVGGVETTEMAEVDLSTLTWQKYTTNGINSFYAQVSGKAFDVSKPPLALCNEIPCKLDSNVTATTIKTFPNMIGQHSSNAYIYIYNPLWEDLLASEIPSMMSGTKLIYTLATTTTNQGAGSAVALLKGDNVLSTDGDELAVNFKQYPDDRLVLDKFGELESDPDSAVDSQAVSNFTVYDPARVQFYMDYEAIPYDYDVKAELVSGSYSNEKIYSYPYPYTYGAGVNGEIHVTNDGTVPAYCKLTIVGEVEDPTWSVYQNGNLIERGRVTATIVSGHKLVMNSQPRSLELSEYSIDGTFIANLYGVSDFSTKRFITIPVGESTITVTHTGDDPFDMYLEVYPLAKTI